ncbi:hypothetical protein BXZ70DRAFT_747888 [Cristinia sonorae]|uniref:Ubiquitin-like protease family profile domain-containing protein n=1 Tax=Cristinia sonorae TaxID=1940300 RepID=A0A8K0UEY7_9AGAR|nr:hypothetical protein BXZ70DRAFT_747888 [Cristinia sonorae]
MVPPVRQPRLFIFYTFRIRAGFMSKQSSSGNCLVMSAELGSYFYQRRVGDLIRKIRRKEKWPLWDKQVILIPVCGSSHWFLIAILNPRRVLEPPSGDNPLRTRCCTLVFDSLGIPRPDISAEVNRYLEERARMENLEFLSATYTVDVMVPLQPNGHDCGIFTIFYATTVMFAFDWVMQMIAQQPDRTADITVKAGHLSNWGKVGDIIQIRQHLLDTLETSMRKPVERPADDGDDSDIEVSELYPTGSIPAVKRGQVAPTHPFNTVDNPIVIDDD